MPNYKLPAQGRQWEDVKAAMADARNDDRPWHGERIFMGGSYYSRPDVVDVANAAYQMYINYNALFANKLFPSLARYEVDIVDLLLGMLNAPDQGGGSLTVGGTESIIVAVMAAHDWARQHKRCPGVPEIVVPRAAHPGFDKAAHMMGLEAVRMSGSVDFRADVAAMAHAIGDNTIMIVGSAPSYPYGVTDPISEIASLAERHDLWFHVDACNGGFIFPFARKLGYPVIDFDFAVPAVTSISVDIHKLGYANKGVSALLLRDRSLEAHHRFTFDNWPSGIYSTPNIIGSRSGGGVASAWAVIHYLGERGYLDIVGRIMEIRRRFVGGIRAIEGLEVFGEPDAYLVAFGSNELDIFAIDDEMAERGWINSQGVEPPAVHLFVDMSHENIVDEYLRDLAEAVEMARAGRAARRGDRAVYAT